MQREEVEKRQKDWKLGETEKGRQKQGEKGRDEETQLQPDPELQTCPGRRGRVRVSGLVAGARVFLLGKNLDSSAQREGPASC